MTKLTTLFCLGLLAAGRLSAHAAGDAKATELLGQARAALGGDAALAKVQGLSCVGTIGRLLGDRQVTGELTIDLQLPNRMLRSDSISPLGDVVLVTEQGLNGDTLLQNTKTMNVPPGAVIRTPPPPQAGSDAEAQALRNARAELARLTVALLLVAPSSMPLEFSYGGTAESPDGKADVIDVKGPSAFAAQLFLDASTHRPLMLAYKGVAPQIRVQTRQGPPPPASAGAQGRADGPPGQAQAPQVVDIKLFLDDYRSVNGVLLPHHVTRAIDGQTNEEWTFKTIRVNPAFKAESFSVK